MTTQETLRILHITPHLGGGIGKALLSLVKGSGGKAEAHSFLLLEKPEKKQFFDQLLSLGCSIRICPDDQLARDLISHADVVQLEWWNHPATFAFLCTRKLPPMRLLTWCHQSGLYPPLIPPGLIEMSDRFVFTSPCSLKAPYISALPNEMKAKLCVVSSGVGLDNPLEREEQMDAPLRACYMGTLSFSKLHPEYVKFLAAVTQPDFRVTMIGDEVNRDLLRRQCETTGRPHLLDFTGFIPDISTALASADIFVYLLNPTHYGTAENALLEAMSAGVVPIVLDNPCETAIVEDGRNGLVVDSPEHFAHAVEWLSEHPDEWKRLSRATSQFVQETFTPAKIAEAMAVNYRLIYPSKKRKIRFNSIFGFRPSEWFLACRRSSKDTISDLEQKFGQYNRDDLTKGSIRHFSGYFPDDDELKSM
jgi:L-malate glycosyltransferase